MITRILLVSISLILHFLTYYLTFLTNFFFCQGASGKCFLQFSERVSSILSRFFIPTKQSLHIQRNDNVRHTYTSGKIS